jgi:hypothetical protein
MFRLIGFIAGCAISLTLLYLTIGTPDFHWSEFESDQARFDAALEKVKDKLPQAIETGDTPPAGIAAEQPSLLPADLPIPVDDTALEADESPGGNTATEAIDSVALQHAALTAGRDSERQWQDIWAPFRSEIAARGFVDRLEEVTGLDYRITKVKAGVYQVGVAYDNDSDRIAHISQINAATGLELAQ